MSKTTSVFANHNLNTTTLVALAEDLSSRLGAHVEYGYQNSFDYEKNINDVAYDRDNVILGTINFPDATKTYTLLDTKYQYKEFIEKYGIQELENQYFKEISFYKDEILEAQKAVAYDLEVDYEIEITIFRDTMDVWLVESMGWHYFQRLFLYYQDSVRISSLECWRIKNRDWIYKLGGDSMIVCCYEDRSAIVFDEAIFKTYLQIKELITATFMGELVNVPNYLKKNLFLKKPQYIQKPIDRNHFRKLDYINNNELYKHLKDVNYPSFFYDDFHDLEHSKPIIKEFDILFDGSYIIEQELFNENYVDNLKIQHEAIELKIPETSFLIYEGYIQGLQHYSFFHCNMTMKINEELYLQLEPENKFDKNAIAIAIDNDIQDKKLGYIAKHDNKILAKLLLNNQKLRCYLTAINEKAVNTNELNSVLKFAIYFEK